MLPISINSREAIKFGWQKFVTDIGYWLVIMLLALVVFAVPSYIAAQLEQSVSVLAYVVTIAAWVLQIAVGLGLIGQALKIVDGAKPPVMDIFSYFNFIWRYFLASTLYGLIMFIGLILLVVPGIIWAVKYSLFSYFIIDKQAKPLEALQLSADATQGIKGQLSLFLLLLLLINIVGAAAFGLGLFITLPVTYLAWGYIYRQLSSRPPVPVLVPKTKKK